MPNASDIVSPNNPANKTVEAKGARKRIPMSVPSRKLEVPEIPGYHLHWVKESNIGRALAAAYEFVDYNEVPVNQRNVGMDTTITGNQDLGSRISLAAGIGANGATEHLFLMKLKEDYWLEDRKQIDSRNAQLLSGIFQGEQIMGSDQDQSGDQGTRYVDRERTKTSLFQRRRAKT